MPDRQPVIELIRPDEDELRQERLISKFCAERDLKVTVRVQSIDAAAQVVAAGVVATVVAVSDRHDGLRHLISIAGGTVLFIRTRSRIPSLREWLTRAARRGTTPSQIGRAVGESTTDVRRLMRELGIQPPDER